MKLPTATIACIGMALVWAVTAAPVMATTTIWKAENTTVVHGLSYNELEFENPLNGTETQDGYRVIDWRDADYHSSTDYEDWTVFKGPDGTVDGEHDEVWMRHNATGDVDQYMSTTTTVESTVVSISFNADSNDGLCDIYVDATLVASLDMGSNPADAVAVRVDGLPLTTHAIVVWAMGTGALGQDDVAVYGAAALARRYQGEKEAVVSFSGSATSTGSFGFKMVARGDACDAAPIASVVVSYDGEAGGDPTTSEEIRSDTWARLTSILPVGYVAFPTTWSGDPAIMIRALQELGGDFFDVCIGAGATPTWVKIVGEAHVDTWNSGNGFTIDGEDKKKSAIPAVSEWGLVVMALVGLVAGTIVFGRRRRLAAD